MIPFRCLLFAAVVVRLGAQNVDFAARIQPVLNASCVPCHRGDKPGGGIRLDSPDGVARVVIPGDTAGSMLYKRITTDDRTLRMPLGMAALPPDTIVLIRQWIEQGAQGIAIVDYTRDVQPIFQANCYACHKGPNAPAGLHLDVRASAGKEIQPGNSRDSRLVHRVLGQGGEPRMPFKRTPLSDDQIATLARWIDQGAKWPDAQAGSEAKHWAYVKPVRPPVPPVRRKEWVRNAIDAFVLARLEKEGLEPSPEASRETLIRRVSLDLIGLPPSPQQIDDFVKDERPDAYERLVDGLLANPHFGERQARPWLDWSRYADTNGFEKDERRSMWRYRDWLIEALNKDMPFDEFTIEQLAGDLLPNATVEQKIATGFNRNTLFNEEGGVDKDEEHWVQLVDRVNTTATVWLGSTLGCAQCHNHKFDPFTQKEYYQFLAFFDNAAYKEKKYGDTTRKYIEPQLSLPTPEQSLRRDELDARSGALEFKVKTLETPELDAQQSKWEATMRSLESAWLPLERDSGRSLGGAKLDRQADGSWLASGLNPDTDSYVVDGQVSGRKPIVAIRIQTLPHPSLPRGGPGRDVYGNFALSSVRVEAITKSGEAQPLPIAAAKADGGHVKKKKDKPERPLWEVDATRDETRMARQLVLTLASPVKARAFRVTLVHASEYSGQGIGRFRIEATSSPEAEKTVDVPAEVRPALALAPEKRTMRQVEQLSAAFREVTPSLEPYRRELKRLEKQMDSLGIVTTLIMGDRPGVEIPTAPMRIRGSFLSPGEVVPAGTPAALSPWPEGAPRSRLGLARWVVSRDNPLTARVAVNRIWEEYFGHGIVETSEDFGAQGERPTHPELLDWLAVEFMENGWSQKAITRLMVTSSTYRQDSRVTPELEERDKYNRLLARGPRFRVEAEMVRDIVLSASGLLDDKIGGPSVFPYQPEGVWDLPYNDDTWKISKGADRYRRGLYTFVRRTSPYPSMTVFDAPSREVCTIRRVRTNTPLQALTTMNDPVFFEAAGALAKRVTRQAGLSPEDRAALAFRLCTGRKPKPSEVSAIVAMLNREVEDFRGDPAKAARLGGDADTAAWTMVSNSLLNLDETVTKE